MPYDPIPDLAGLTLSEVAEAIAARRLPPVSQWNPEESGDSEMRIAADGRWYHQGSPIHRPAMVRAFSGLLRREGEAFWLVTPHQKLSIEVEDAPFVAQDVKLDEENEKPILTFRTNTDDLVIADAEHPVIARGNADTPALYVLVREGLEARLNRSTYEQLAQIAIERDEDPLCVVSRAVRFPLVPA